MLGIPDPKLKQAYRLGQLAAKLAVAAVAVTLIKLVWWIWAQPW
jgi:hypothetical protein